MHTHQVIMDSAFSKTAAPARGASEHRKLQWTVITGRIQRTGHINFPMNSG